MPSTTAQKKYVVRLEAATTAGPNTSRGNLGAMTDAAIGAEIKAVKALLEAMKRRLKVLQAESGRRKRSR